MAELVYGLCVLTSLICSALLIRGYTRNRTIFLFWSALCFLGLAVNNLLLFVDLVILPKSIDLSLIRTVVTLISTSFIVYGFVWEKR